MSKENVNERYRHTRLSNGQYGELDIYEIDADNEEQTNQRELESDLENSSSQGINEDDFDEMEDDLRPGAAIVKTAGKYFVFICLSLVFWETIMMIQLGKLSASSLIFLFFIPAQAMILTTIAGIGNKLSSRITLPIIMGILAFYYIAQTIYLRSAGSLISISMLGLGNDAVGNFGWAVTGTIIKAIWLMVILSIPVIAAIVLPFFKFGKIDAYRLVGHIITASCAIVLWFMAVLCIRAFGNDRLSPYYQLTSSSAVTDSSARKLGVLTTSMAEAGAYYLGIGNASEMDFELEEEDEFAIASDMPVVSVDISEQDGEEVETAVREPWVNEAIDFKKIADDTDDEKLKSLANYFATRRATCTNDFTGMFEGYNLIYICAESFWNYACNEEVTPTLYKMAHNGIVLNNYYNSFYNTTTNGEFAFCTSLWPDVSRNSKNGTDIGSFAQSSTKYMPQGLGDLFTAQGVPAYAFHNYYGKYYRRTLSWPNLGYTCRFTGDRGMYFTSNWPASDYELMLQTVDDYINDDVFHAYYMTFSGHGPYTSKNAIHNKNIDAVNSILGTDKYNDMARGYLAGEVELDMAMEYLLKRLEEAGKLENTVIVLTGDHYPYYLEKEARDSLVGYEMDEDFEIYHSNCFIYNAGITTPIEVDNYCCNIDIAPTICNLFNIPFESRLMIGKDIFSDEAHNRATLYNMSFIDDYVAYNYETGEAKWTTKASELSDEQKQKHLDKQLRSIENEYMASCRAIEENFFLSVYDKAGLITAQEMAEEKLRAENAQNQDDNFNAEDEAEKAEKEAQKLLQQQIEQGLVMLDENGNPVMIPGATVVDPDAAATAIDPNAIVADPNAVPAADPNVQPAGEVNVPPAEDLNAAVADPNAGVIVNNSVEAIINEQLNVDPNVVIPAQ